MNKQSGFTAVEGLLIALMVGVAIFGGWYILGKNGDTGSGAPIIIDETESVVADEATMRGLYECDRMTADARATDVYCSDYNQFVSDARNETLLGENDFNEYYELIRMRQVQRRDGCGAEKPGDGGSYTEDYIMCRIYVLVDELPVSQDYMVEEITNTEDHQFLDFQLNGSGRVELGQYVVETAGHTLLYDPEEDRVLLNLEVVE